MGRLEAEKVDVEVRLPIALSVIERVSLAERESDDCALTEDFREAVALMDRCVIVDCVEGDGATDSVAAYDGDALKHVVDEYDSTTDTVGDEIAENEGCEADAERLGAADVDGVIESDDEKDGAADALKLNVEVLDNCDEEESVGAAVENAEYDGIEAVAV